MNTVSDPSSYKGMPLDMKITQDSEDGVLDQSVKAKTIENDTLDDVDPNTIPGSNQTNSVALIPSPDQQRYIQLHEQFFDSCVWQTPLLNGDQKIPPYGAPKYSSEERWKRLQNISLLKIGNQENLAPGCSLVMTLIMDELRECYQIFDKKYLKQQDKKALNDFKKKVELLIAPLCEAGRTLCSFSGNLSFQKPISTLHLHQEDFLTNRGYVLSDNGRILLHPNILHKILKNTAEGKRCLAALNLLEDFVTQEMHSLFKPYVDGIDFVNSFSRLYRRTNFFLKTLQNEEGFDSIEKNVVKKYAPLLKRSNKSFIEFCNIILPLLTKLQKKIDHRTIANLWVNLESYLSNCQLTTDRKALAGQLSLDNLENARDDSEDKSFQEYLRLTTNIQWSYQTLLDEVYVAMLVHLIEASRVSNFEIDSCVENLLKSTKIIENYSIKEMKLQLQNCFGGNGNEDLSMLLIMEFEKDNKLSFEPVIKHLEIRIKRCSNDLNDQLERALLLRDVLLLLGANLNFGVQLFGNYLMQLQTISAATTPKKFLPFILANEELHNMQVEGITAAVQGIKALVGRCLNEMEIQLQIENQKAVASLEMESMKAKLAGEELVRAQEANKKTRIQTQKKPEKAKPISVKINTNLKNGQDVVKPTPSSTEIIPKIKKEVEPAFEDLPDFSINLAKCKLQLSTLKSNQFASENSWQEDQIQNLDYLLDSLLEIKNIQAFSPDLFFEKTDLLRRSVEAILGIATAYLQMSHEKVKTFGHDTKKLFGVLLNAVGVPENVRKLLWKMRSVPAFFADANRCVNYPAEAYAKQVHFDAEGRELINFLIEVDREGQSAQINENSRKFHIEQLNHSLERGTYFIERLLAALLNPSEEISGELPIEEVSNKASSSEIESNSDESISEVQLLSDQIIQEESLKIPSIQNREEALQAIDTALIWIRIRRMAPTEGSLFLQMRTEERNLALLNSEIYLRRLKEKLGPERNLRPMSTILGQCQLIRRCQKELLIAVLYHTDSFVDGQHIIEARNLRFTNSPCVLMKILRDVSSRPKGLPFIGNWMHRAHQILSYPASSQESLEGDFSANQLQQIVFEVRQASKELRVYAADEVIFIKSSKRTPEKRLQERIELVKANEEERIFPGVAALLHTLKFGLSLPKHKYLNG